MASPALTIMKQVFFSSSAFLCTALLSLPFSQQVRIRLLSERDAKKNNKVSNPARAQAYPAQTELAPPFCLTPVA